jgi:uncharacterized membrane protein YqjE
MIRTQSNRSVHHEDIRLGEAALDVVQAGQRVLIDRIELIVLELRELAARIEKQAFLGVLALILLATAWVALNWTAVAALSDHVSRPAAGSVVAVINAVLAVGMLLWARQAGEGGKS